MSFQSFSLGVINSANLSQQWCVTYNMHQVLPTRKVYLSLDVQSFSWSSVMQTWFTACKADLSLQPLQAGPTPPPKITLLAQTVWWGPRLPCKQRRSYRAGFSQGLEIISQKLKAKVRPPFWVRLRFHCTLILRKLVWTVLSSLEWHLSASLWRY